MSNYWGFDVSYYPGNAAMNAWFNKYKFTGFYLAPAPTHTDTSWMNKKNYLDSIGYGYLPIYCGRQEGSSNLTTAIGKSDAHAAANLASTAGFPSNSYIYLDIEEGGLLSSNFINYIVGWVSEIENHTNYSAGIYCSYSQTADQILNATGGYAVRFWVYHIDTTITPGSGSAPSPSNSGISYARAWQFRQNYSQTVGGYTISADYNTSMYSDPSQ